MLSLQLFAGNRTELETASSKRLEAIAEIANKRLEIAKTAKRDAVIDSDTKKVLVDEKQVGALMSGIATTIGETVLLSAGMVELNRVRQHRFSGILERCKVYPSDVLRAAALGVELSAWAKEEPTLFPRDYTNGELVAMVKSGMFQTTMEIGDIRKIERGPKLNPNVEAAATCKACIESMDKMGISRKETVRRFHQMIAEMNKADKLAAKTAAKAPEQPADKPADTK